MKQTNTKKLAVAAVFCAVAVAGSLFSFPVFGSKCSPVQHMVNILCAVLLGPGYGLGAAFAAALIRNLLGLGSLMAFPGSMFGALICGLVYQKTQNIPATLIGEVFGTSVLGGLTAYPVAVFLMGKSAGRSGILRICDPVPCFNCGRCSDQRCADLQLKESQYPCRDAASNGTVEEREAC